jgi:hypothetical protein
MSRDRTFTYMEASEFARIGERCFGYGWQQKLAEFVGYNRVQINRYACAAEPIPPHIATLLPMLAEKLDAGEPLQMPKPVGQVLDGQFKKTYG